MQMDWRRVRALVLPLVFVSGASALIYEVSWFRLASLSFGVSVYAASAVLIAFMAGLALGSALVGRLGRAAELLAPHERRRAGLRWYAGLQAAIGVYALATPWIFQAVGGVYLWLDDWLQPDRPLTLALRLALALAAMLLPTTLMGASFPAASRAFARTPGARGGDLGMLYALNTLGGVVGALSAGLLLIPQVGVTATILTAGVLDLVLAVLAWWLARRAPAHADTSLEAALPPREERRRDERTLAATTSGGRPRRQARAGAPTDGDRAATTATPVAAPPWLALPAARIALVGYAVSGFAALAYQVIWTRMLAIFSLNAVYSFTVMLAVFLTGLALGSLTTARSADRIADPLRRFGLMQLAIALTSTLVLYVFARLRTLLDWFTSPQDMLGALWAETFAAGVTMLLPTFLLGAMFPLAVRLFVTDDARLMAPLGRLYALNTLASMAGAFIAGFVLIPWLGLQHAALVAVALNAVVGTVALVASSPPAPRTLAGALGATLLAVVLLPPGVYLGFREGAIPELKFYREGVDATVAVFEVRSPPLKVSFVNGRNEVPTDRDSMQAFYFLGHVPPLLRPDAREALMISFGNGIASGAMATHAIPRIHAVELVAEQVAAAELYEVENRGILHDSRFSITIEDGRNYALRSDEQYDIITADATHPINSSSWALFTDEFYRLIQARLAPGGVFVQWLPFHDLAQDDLRAIIATFGAVFPNASVWYTGGTHAFLVATPQPLDAAAVRALEPRLQASAAARADLGAIDDLVDDLLFDRAELDEYTAGARIVRDDDAFFTPARDVERIIASFVPYMR
jgi:spermidine synthase